MAGKNIHIIDDQNFDAEVLQSQTPVLIDFHATWCGPCKALSPIIAQIAEDFEGKIKVGKVDIDAAPKLASKYGIRSVPTVMVFENGEKKATQMGLVPRAKLLKLAGLA